MESADQVNEDQGRITLPRAVREKEVAHIKNRRKAAGIEGSDAGCRVGLAISGGGIRSATFAFGILQHLAGKGVLRFVDYMCTVSGGGYIGSCLSSLLTIPRKAGEGESAGNGWKRRFLADPSRSPLNHPGQIHHLRTHGDFLILQKGLFRRDVLRTVGVLMRGLFATLLLFTAALCAVVGLVFLYGWLFGGLGLVWQEVTRALQAGTLDTIGFDAVALGRGISLEWGWAVAVFLAAVLLTFLFFWFAVLPYLKEKPRWKPMWQYGRLIGESVTERAAEKEERILLTWYSGLLLLVVLGISAVSRFAVHIDKDAGFWGAVPGLFLPAVGFAGAAMAAMCISVRFTRWMMGDSLRNSGKKFGRSMEVRSCVNSLAGIGLYYTAAGFIIAGTILFACMVPGVHWPEVGTVVSLVVTFLMRPKAKEASQAGGEKKFLAGLRQSAKNLLLALAVPLFIFLAAFSLMVLCVGSNGMFDPGTWGGLLLLVLGIATVLVLGFLVDYNRISLHYFYRDRLTEAYLQTEEPGDRDSELVRDDDTLDLKRLHDFGEDEEMVSPGPYHLLLCALNLSGSSDLLRKDRKSDHFIFSRHYCGSTTTGYVPTETYREGRTKLARAMAISGAAAASAMGFRTSFSQAFAMTLLNIRLGFWMENPARYGSDEDHVMTRFARDSRGGETRAPYMRHPNPEMRRKRPAGRFIFWPKYLFCEMAAWTKANGRLVNLSDGGHTGDNLGLYPLLQRRCRLIIVCDGECDGAYRFESLRAAVNQIFIDENVRVHINVDAVRESIGKRGGPLHHVIGKIEYPPSVSTGKDVAGEPSVENDGAGETGWLLYLKSSFFDDKEPFEVKSYARNQEAFPHQTTADQFFDEDQFEAYRSLGHHIAGSVSWPDSRAVKDEDFVNRMIMWCAQQYGEPQPEPGEPPKPERKRLASRDEVIRPLEDQKWDVKKAAKMSGVSVTTFRRRMKEFEIKRP